MFSRLVLLISSGICLALAFAAFAVFSKEQHKSQPQVAPVASQNVGKSTQPSEAPRNVATGVNQKDGVEGKAVPTQQKAQSATQREIQLPPSKPSEAQIRFVMQHTLPTNRPERFLDGAPAWPNYFEPCSEMVTVPDGYGGYLSAIVGYWMGGASADRRLVFFWRNDKYLGTDNAYGYLYPRISPVGNKIAVTYPTWPEGKAKVDVDWEHQSGTVVYFWWNGSRLVNSGGLEEIFSGECKTCGGFKYFPNAS